MGAEDHSLACVSGPCFMGRKNCMRLNDVPHEHQNLHAQKQIRKDILARNSYFFMIPQLS